MDGERDDIERLKVHKITPERKRRHLPTLGQPHPFDPQEERLTEAFGGPLSASEAPALDVVSPDVLEERVVDAIRMVFDPEIPVNLYDLGLIYGIDVGAEGEVEVRMTLTAPACPVAGSLVTEVAEKVGRVPGVLRSHVKLVWDPPWSPERMTDEAKLELGLL